MKRDLTPTEPPVISSFEIREEIARGLHDRIGQPLMALKFAMSTLKDLPEKNLPVLDEMSQTISELQVEVRKLILSLQPSEVSLDLKPALLSVVATSNQRTKMKVNLDHSGLDENVIIPVDVTQVLVKFIEEVLAQVSLHSDATEAIVRVWNTGGNINTRIEDNSTQIWLNNIYHTANQAHGRLVVEGTKNKGTRVTATYPLVKG